MTNNSTTTNGQPRQRRRWDYEKWITTAVSPAPPGWFAIYGRQDGTYRTMPLVALLTQESTETEWIEDVSTDDKIKLVTTTEPHEYTQRVVFAKVDYEFGELEAIDISGIELVGVATEREIADEWQELFDEACRDAREAKAAKARKETT